MPKNDDLLPQYQPEDQQAQQQSVDPNQIASDIIERMYLVVRSVK